MKALPKTQVKEVLAAWSKSCRVFAPVRKDQGDVLVDLFDGPSFTLEYGKPPLPPKSVYLPHSEVIYRVEQGGYRAVVSGEPTVLFGIRACDAMGIAQSSRFMGRDRDDLYYRRKAELTFRVVAACPGPQNETCFCTTMRSGPWARSGFDLQLYDDGERFLIEVGSEKGADLLDGPLFEEVEDAGGRRRIAAFREKAADSIPPAPQVVEAMERLRAGAGNDDVWDRLGNKCITCGGCAFVCPTCTCFNVHDREQSPGNGLRMRTWDTCLYGGFTREASGHNPRGTQPLRLKRRHEHKLLYYNASDVGEALCGCVGCGRCSDFCPVHIGTLEVTSAIAGNR